MQSALVAHVRVHQSARQLLVGSHALLVGPHGSPAPDSEHVGHAVVRQVVSALYMDTLAMCCDSQVFTHTVVGQ